MRWIMLLIVVAFLLSTFLMYEGRGGRSQRRGTDGRIQDYEVAEVNGKPLMRSELERRVGNYLEQSQRRDMASADLPALYRSALDQYATELQLAEEVKERGITVSEAQVDQTMKEYADQAFPTREAFYQALERSGVSIADYKKSISRQMANELLLKTVVGDVTVSEDESVKFYDTMKSMFYRQPSGFKVYLANFVVSDDAEALRGKLLGGENWLQATSGDVLASKDVISVTSEAVFLPASAFDSGPLAPMKDLKVGEPSLVFEISSNDFAVGMKKELVEEKTLPYDEVSADIRVLLRQQKERELITSFDKELLGKAKIMIHDPSLFADAKAPVSEDRPVPASTDVLSVDSGSRQNTSADAASGDKKP